MMAKHRARKLFLPGAGRRLWCRRCTCVSTRKAWTRDAPAAPSCPSWVAPAHEARDWRALALVNGLPEEARAEGEPQPVAGRNAGYVRPSRVRDND